MRYEVLFSYPSKDTDDFTVWTETKDGVMKYKASIECYIGYKDIDDVTNYYTGMLVAFSDWLVKNGIMLFMDYKKFPTLYKTQYMEIWHWGDNEDIWVTTQAPYFRDLYEVKEWLMDLIGQLQKIKKDGLICKV